VLARSPAGDLKHNQRHVLLTVVVVPILEAAGHDAPRLPDGVDPKPTSAEIVERAYCPVDALPRPINAFTIQRIKDAQSSTPVAICVLGPRQWFTRWWAITMHALLR
jgi:hypothetical protein